MTTLLTGLFGGSFNPIHRGHIELARQLLRLAALDEVWLMVSPHNPLKAAADLAPDELRLRMAREALRGEPHISVSDYEMRLPRPSYTYNTLCHLTADYPDREFVLLIGADNWQCFGSWRNSQELLARHRIVIYPRQGYPVDAATLPPTVTLVPADIINISSTDIRRRIRQHLPFAHLVSESTEKIIRAEGAYGFEK